MTETIRRVDYFYMTVPNKPGEVGVAVQWGRTREDPMTSDYFYIAQQTRRRGAGVEHPKRSGH